MEEYFLQYAICGFKKGKWYREHPNFPNLESAKKHIIINRHKLRNYERIKIQSRKISKWEDVGE